VQLDTPCETGLLETGFSAVLVPQSPARRLIRSYPPSMSAGQRIASEWGGQRAVASPGEYKSVCYYLFGSPQDWLLLPGDGRFEVPSWTWRLVTESPV